MQTCSDLQLDFHSLSIYHLLSPLFLQSSLQQVFLILGVTIVAFNAVGNSALYETNISINGTNYNPPIQMTVAPGTILNMTAAAVGFTTETQIVTVYAASILNNLQVTFIMSGQLVSKPKTGNVSNFKYKLFGPTLEIIDIICFFIFCN